MAVAMGAENADRQSRVATNRGDMGWITYAGSPNLHTRVPCRKPSGQLFRIIPQSGIDDRCLGMQTRMVLVRPMDKRQAGSH